MSPSVTVTANEIISNDATPLQATSISKRAATTGLVLSALAVLFLGFDAVGKLLQLPQVVEGTTQLGYPKSLIVPFGIIQVVCLIAYLLPRTSVLGAILWTGYLGGAIATHVRLEDPLFTHVLFPAYVAALLWGGLWLRNAPLRTLIPLRKTRNA